MQHQPHLWQETRENTRQNLDLACLIASFRQQRGLSQEQLARACRLVNDFYYHTQTLTHRLDYQKLRKQLQKLPDFSRIARSSSIGMQPPPSFRVQIYHQCLGMLAFKTITMQVKGSHNDWMVWYIPDDQRTWHYYHLHFG